MRFGKSNEWWNGNRILSDQGSSYTATSSRMTKIASVLVFCVFQWIYVGTVIPRSMAFQMLPYPRPSVRIPRNLVSQRFSNVQKNNDGDDNVVANSAAVIELTHPSTGCNVTLVGVVHGSASSSNDVAKTLERNDVDVVVLELCASRFADMRRDMELNTNSDDGMYMPQKLNQTMDKFLRLVAMTVDRKGLASGIATFIIGGVSLVQSIVSGFSPGLEFRTAIDHIKRSNGDIILADRDVTETLKRVGHIPKVSVDILRRSFRGDISLLVSESQSLSNALGGSNDERFCDHQINMVKALTNTRDMQLDLARSMLSPALTISTFSSALVVFKPPLVQAVDASEVSVSQMLTSGCTDLIMSVIVLILFYIFLAIPTSRVIISERDQHLANGIRTACHALVDESVKVSCEQNNQHIVAVLGMLHVNGVARHLLEDE